MNKLKKFREKRNIFQEILSRDTMISRQTISAIENGSKPGYETMERIAKYFKVSVSEIFLQIM